MSKESKAVLKAAATLRDDVDQMEFAAPTAFVYNPLRYAWRSHQLYVERFAKQRKRVLLLGMNPGPFGMAQTGVPFGEIAAVRDWMGVTAPVEQPPRVCEKRPVQGFDCPRSEVSGRRLWGAIAERYPRADDFFARHFVVNYCPLVFMEEGGRNRTPDKLPTAERAPLEAACDAHVRSVVQALKPEWILGVGAWAKKSAARACDGLEVQVGSILHPSPASPKANRGWAREARKELAALDIDDVL